MSYRLGDFFAIGVEADRDMATKVDAMLKEFEALLPPGDFVLINRAQLTIGESLPGAVAGIIVFLKVVRSDLSLPARLRHSQ